MVTWGWGGGHFVAVRGATRDGETALPGRVGAWKFLYGVRARSRGKEGAGGEGHEWLDQCVFSL